MPQNTTILTLQGGAGIGSSVQGLAIVSTHGFNARYDMDRTTGVFSRPEHDLYGQSFASRIFVFAAPKGGIATSWALLDLKQRNLAPLGLVCRRANPVIVQGAVLADIPVMDGFDQDPVEVIRTGDLIRLEPSSGELTILQRQ